MTRHECLHAGTVLDASALAGRGSAAPAGREARLRPLRAVVQRVLIRESLRPPAGWCHGHPVASATVSGRPTRLGQSAGRANAR